MGCSRACWGCDMGIKGSLGVTERLGTTLEGVCRGQAGVAKELQGGPRTRSEATTGDEWALNHGLEGLGALFNSFGRA